jgi:hypothetical protein
MQPLSKVFYLGSILGSLGLVFLISVGAAVAFNAAGGDPNQAQFALLLYGSAFIPLIYGIVIVCVLLYKIWAAIQDPPTPARTTPGFAVGLLFVPFFNFYWIFQAYYGWAVDFNKYVSQKGIAAPQQSEGIPLTLCILVLVGLIPCFAPFTGLVDLVLLLLFFSGAIDGVNALIAAKRTA